MNDWIPALLVILITGCFIWFIMKPLTLKLMEAIDQNYQDKINTIKKEDV